VKLFEVHLGGKKLILWISFKILLETIRTSSSSPAYVTDKWSAIQSAGVNSNAFPSEFDKPNQNYTIGKTEEVIMQATCGIYGIWL